MSLLYVGTLRRRICRNKTQAGSCLYTFRLGTNSPAFPDKALRHFTAYFQKQTAHHKTMCWIGKEYIV